MSPPKFIASRICWHNDFIKESAMPNDEICNMWQGQGIGSAPFTLEEIRRKSGKFRSQISRRNFREYLVSALLIPYFGYYVWTARSPMMQAGNGLSSEARRAGQE